jgi:hypothetical protein
MHLEYVYVNYFTELFLRLLWKTLYIVHSVQHEKLLCSDVNLRLAS